MQLARFPIALVGRNQFRRQTTTAALFAASPLTNNPTRSSILSLIIFSGQRLFSDDSSDYYERQTQFKRNSNSAGTGTGGSSRKTRSNDLSLVRPMARSAIQSQSQQTRKKSKDRRGPSDYKQRKSHGDFRSNNSSPDFSRSRGRDDSRQPRKPSWNNNSSSSSRGRDHHDNNTNNDRQQGKKQQYANKHQQRNQSPYPTKTTAEKVPEESIINPKPMFREDWINARRKGQDGTLARSGSGFDDERTNEKGIFNRKHQSKRRVAPSTYEEKRKQDPEAIAMSFPPNDMRVFLSCLPGLEPYLVEEMSDMGFDCKMEAGGVTPKSTMTTDNILDCHLQLGIASHILVRCGEFTARGLPELRRKAAQLPWHQFLTPNTAIKVRSTSKKSKLNHKTAIRSALIDGMNESYSNFDPRMTNAISQATEETVDALTVSVRVENDLVTISVDTSATPMHRRGYRLETGKAPLREDLAYSMIYSAGWRASSKPDAVTTSELAITGFERLLDPFCGSGTIAIEAASLAAGLAPGRLRDPPLGGTVLYDPKKWRQRIGKFQRKATRTVGKDESVRIAASDRNQGAVDIAKANAKRAGVEDFIDIQCLSMSAHPWLGTGTGKGADDDNVLATSLSSLLVATNPPFGMRIAADNKKRRIHPLLPMYQTLVERQRRLVKAGASVSAITLLQDVNVFRRTGADFEVKFSSQHGGIPVAAAYTNLSDELDDDEALPSY